MGSPVSVVISEITMQMFERRLFQNNIIDLTFWFRLIDDTISAVDSSQVQSFLNYLNSVEPSLQFTHEIE
jgi:hypothetical protein